MGTSVIHDRPGEPSVTPAMRPSRATTVVGALGLLATAVSVVLTIPAMTRVGLHGFYITDVLIGGSFTVLGIVVTRRRPEHRIGWLFLAIGATEAVTAAANHIAIVGLASGARPAPAGGRRSTCRSPSSRSSPGRRPHGAGGWAMPVR